VLHKAGPALSTGSFFPPLNGYFDYLPYFADQTSCEPIVLVDWTERRSMAVARVRFGDEDLGLMLPSTKYCNLRVPKQASATVETHVRSRSRLPSPRRAGGTNLI
jgi:hypothetical protein